MQDAGDKERQERAKQAESRSENSDSVSKAYAAPCVLDSGNKERHENESGCGKDRVRRSR